MAWSARVENDKVVMEASFGEGSGAIIEITKDSIRLFEIPLYGGECLDGGTFTDVLSAMKAAEAFG